MSTTIENPEYALDLSPGSLQAQCLAIIRAERWIEESTLLGRIFPGPKFPEVRTPEAVEAWRKADEDWKAKAFYKAGVVEYRDCMSSRISCATIALRRAGLIHTTNNGFNCYTYHAR